MHAARVCGSRSGIPSRLVTCDFTQCASLPFRFINNGRRVPQINTGIPPVSGASSHVTARDVVNIRHPEPRARFFGLAARVTVARASFSLEARQCPSERSPRTERPCESEQQRHNWKQSSRPIHTCTGELALRYLYARSAICYARSEL